jgi:hypothetical protein
LPRRAGRGPNRIPDARAFEYAVLHAPFALYGLSDSFTGIRWVAQQDALPSHIVLGHGDPRAEPPQWVRVGVMLRDPAAHFVEFGRGWIDIVGTLAGMHGAAEGLHLTQEQTHSMEWADVDLVVDGLTRPFRVVGDEQHWLAYREEEETWLFVHARGVAGDSIELVPVDPEPYLSGSRRLDG